MMRMNDQWICKACDYSTLYKHVIVGHIESKHVDIGGAPCQFCPKVCPTRHALQMHVKRNHQQ